MKSNEMKSDLESLKKMYNQTSPKIKFELTKKCNSNFQKKIMEEKIMNNEELIKYNLEKKVQKLF